MLTSKIGFFDLREEIFHDVVSKLGNGFEQNLFQGIRLALQKKIHSLNRQKDFCVSNFVRKGANCMLVSKTIASIVFSLLTFFRWCFDATKNIYP